MASEKQIEANRKNALKSTGPKTEEGKRRASRNAMKDGFTGDGTHLHPDDTKQLKKLMRKWVETLLPIDDVEMEYVRRAVVAKARTRRCVKKDLAELAQRRRRAVKRFDRRQRKDAADRALLLESRPSLALRQLRGDSYGCDWLIERWTELEEALEVESSWAPEQCQLAVQLLGRRATDHHRNDPLLETLRLQMLVLRPAFGPEDIRSFFGLNDQQMDDPEVQQAVVSRLPDPAAARQALCELAQAQRQDLEERAEALWEARDSVLCREAEDRSLVDTSDAGMRLHRYERDNELLMHRCLKDLFAMRKQENECYSTKRWEENRKRYGREWDGRQWVPDPYSSITMPQYVPEMAQDGPDMTPQPAGEEVTRAATRNEANPSDQPVDNQATYGDPHDAPGPCPEPSEEAPKGTPESSAGALDRWLSAYRPEIDR